MYLIYLSAVSMFFFWHNKWKYFQCLSNTHINISGLLGFFQGMFLVILRSVFLCVFFQVLRLTQKEQVLEERLASVGKENDELRASLASLQTRLALHDQLNQQHSQQVHTQIHHTLVLKKHRQTKSVILFFKVNRQ